MKKLSTLIFALSLSIVLLGQEKPDAQMWFDSGVLFYGDKSANVISEDFSGTVKSWTNGKVHISVSARTIPETISLLLLNIPYTDVSYSLCLDKDRLAAASATERYYRNLPETEGIPAISADTQPVFLGGDLNEWIKKEVDQLYPRECWENSYNLPVVFQH